jgi:ATP-dependent DNA helicase DinG
VIEEIAKLVTASDGRALVLFTSTARLRVAYEALKDRLPYTCFAQGDAPNKVLVERFKEDTHSVLFATRSFFTGIDIQGEALSLVILDKLPFPVPSEPVFSAKAELLDARRNGSSFFDLSLPAATITLLQGFGRLIRTVTDHGVVAILDPRLGDGPNGKPYGRRIVKALPPARPLTSVAEVEAFFQEAS